MVVLCNRAADLDNVDQEGENPGENDGPGTSDGEGESVVEEVSVHQMEEPGEAGDGLGQEGGLTPSSDGLSVEGVEDCGLYHRQQGSHQTHHAPGHQEILLEPRPQEPLGGLEPQVVGGDHAQTCLQSGK